MMKMKGGFIGSWRESMGLLLCLLALGLPGATSEKGQGDLGKVTTLPKANQRSLSASRRDTLRVVPCWLVSIRAPYPKADSRESQPWPPHPNPPTLQPWAGRACDRGDAPHGVELQADAGAAQRVRHPRRVLSPMACPSPHFQPPPLLPPTACP